MTNGNDQVHSFYQHESYLADAGPVMGLTKREYFAAAALQGMLANLNTIEELAEAELGPPQQWAVKMADALIEALNKEAK